MNDTPTIMEPVFEGVWFLDDAMTKAGSAIRSDRPLDAAGKAALLNPEAYAYRQVHQPNGTPYMEGIEQTREGPVVRRHYVFVDPEVDLAETLQDPHATFGIVDWVFRVSRTGGITRIMPEEIRRTPDADFIASCRYTNTHQDARTMIFSDTRLSGGVILNTASADAVMRPDILKAWQDLQGVVLDAQGTPALNHMLLHVIGQCSHGHKGHGLRIDHTRQENWQGARLRLRCF